MRNRLRPFVISNRPTPHNLPDSVSLLLDDTNRGFVTNRLTTAEQQQIVDPEIGSLIYNKDNDRFEFWDGTTWSPISSDTAIVNAMTNIDAELDDPSGWNNIFNGDDDDSWVEIVSNFPITWSGQTYNSVFIGSNSYITFGAGSEAYREFLDAINTPGILISAADNSYQNVYVLAEDEILKVRFEGTDETNGTPGEPTILWQANFYANQPNTVDIIVGQNQRDGLTGIISGGTWQFETEKLQNQAVRFISTGAADQTVIAQTDLAEVIQNIIGIDNVSGYWRFDEKPGLSTAHDSGPWGLDASFSGDIAFGRYSAVPDGHTAVALHGGTIAIPFHPTQWPLKSQAMTIFFTGTTSTPYDFIVIEGAGLRSDSTFIRNFEIQFSGVGAEAILYNTANEAWLDLGSQAGTVPISSPFVFCLTVDMQGSMTMWLNDAKHYLNFAAAPSAFNGVRPVFGDTAATQGVLDKSTGIEAGISINGGTDSPTISHLLIWPGTLDDNDYLTLLGATRVLDSKSQRTYQPLGYASANLPEIIESTTPHVWFPMNDRGEIPFINAQDSNSVLRWTAGGPGWQSGWRSPVPDGNSAIRFYDAQLDNFTYDSTYFDNAAFALMVVYTGDDEPNPSLLIEIKHMQVGGSDYTHRLDLVAVTNGPILAALYNTDGSNYLSVFSDVSYRPGSRVFLMAAYDPDTDTLKLVVNDRSWTTTGGSGTLQGTPENVDVNAPSLFVSCAGTLCHLAFFADYPSDPLIDMLRGGCGFIPRMSSEVTQQLTLTDGTVLVIENGLIVNIQSPG